MIRKFKITGYEMVVERVKTLLDNHDIGAIRGLSAANARRENRV